MLGHTRMTVTLAATALPAGVPQVDDTKEMIEHFERLGLIQRVPAAFMIAGVLVIHPALADHLDRGIRSSSWYGSEGL